MEVLRKRKFLLVGLVFGTKLFASFIFSSDYFDKLFYPFLEYFYSNFSNPYSYFLQLGETNKFPYPPLMMYVFSVFGWLSTLFEDFFLSRFILKIPLLLFDLGCFYLLYFIFSKKFFEAFFFYYCSPIVFYVVRVFTLSLILSPRSFYFWPCTFW